MGEAAMGMEAAMAVDGMAVVERPASWEGIKVMVVVCSVASLAVKIAEVNLVAKQVEDVDPEVVALLA